MFSFFGVGMKTDIFQSCGHWWVFQICWHIECSTLIASSFRIWNSLAGIPSPPLVKECFSSVQFSCSVISNSLQPMDHSRPGLPVHHQLPEFTQTHVRWVGDAIQPSHPLSSPSPPALKLSHHQGLFQWVSSLHQVAKLLEFLLQHHSLQWIFRTEFL